MIPLLPDFSSAMAPQAMPQPGAMSIDGAVSGADFAGLLDAALPSELAGPPPSSATAVPTPSASRAFLPDLQPLLQSQPQAQTMPSSEPLPAVLAPPGTPSPSLATLPAGGTPLPPGGAIVPEDAASQPTMPVPPQQPVAPPPAFPAMEGFRDLRPEDDGKGALELTTPNPPPADVLLQASLHSALPATKEAMPPDAPQAPPGPSPLLPLPVEEIAPPASSLAVTAEDLPVDEAFPKETPPLPVPALTPMQPLPLGASKRGVSVADPPDATVAPLEWASPKIAILPLVSPEPPALAQVASPSTRSGPKVLGVNPAPNPGPYAVAQEVVTSSQPARLAAAPVSAPFAQRPEPQVTDPKEIVTGSLVTEAEPALSAPSPAPSSVPIARPVSPSRLAARPEPQSGLAPAASEPATNPLAQPAAATSPDAAPLPSATPASVAQTPASPSPSVLPSAPMIAAAPEPSAAHETARSAPMSQMEETIAAVSDLRETLRAARPEMTLRHAEFGAVSLRLEATGAQDWRVVLASRDPGFVPAIQAALAERAVTAAAETSLAGNGGQSASGEPRYGSSLGSGQGGSQPYPGQSLSRDEGGLAHHQQQRQQRGSGTSAAAADAGSQPGDGGSRERGLFA